jgi:molybdopterin-guanine dinucleotide biosynthesis protein A
VENVTAVILAGGRATRMGGVDKGLLLLAGRPMIAHVIDAVAPQVESVIISANRNLERYAQFGLEVFVDRSDSFDGPLAGVQQAMLSTATPLLITVPCDAPFIPRDLVARLAAEKTRLGAAAAVAHDGARLQPLFALFDTSLLPSLTAYLEQGDRKAEIWLASIPAAVVDFSDEAQGFVNINTAEDIRDAEARLYAE